MDTVPELLQKQEIADIRSGALSFPGIRIRLCGRSR
jgi:hypothetical protein